MNMKLEEIRKYWNEAGKQFPTVGSMTPTSRDPFLSQLEEEYIISSLEKDYLVLEIGCGDASHSVKYAKKVKKLSGVDVAESLIGIAKERADHEGIKNIDFTVASVLDMEKIYRSKKFNCVISQRCLINLPKWQHQKVVILQIYNLLQKDGLFLLTEGFQEGINNLNIIRNKFCLTPIKTVNYNRNMIRKEFELFISQYFDIIERSHYGFYLFLSRIFHPLAVLPNEPKHDSKLNMIAMEISRNIKIPDFERFSYVMSYILRKKG